MYLNVTLSLTSQKDMSALLWWSVGVEPSSLLIRIQAYIWETAHYERDQGELTIHHCEYRAPVRQHQEEGKLAGF